MYCIFCHCRALLQEIVNSLPVLSCASDKIRGKRGENAIKQYCFGKSAILDGKKDVSLQKFSSSKIYRIGNVILYSGI